MINDIRFSARLKAIDVVGPFGMEWAWSWSHKSLRSEWPSLALYSQQSEGTKLDGRKPVSRREGQLEAILEGFSEGICAFDHDWRMTYCNDAAAAYAGMRREDAIGKIYWEAVPSALGSAFEGVLRQAMAERTTAQVEVSSALRPDSFVLVRAFPVMDGLGMSFSDITDRRQREERERQQAQRLELALAASGLGDWSWDVATDLVNLSEAAAAVFGMAGAPVMSWADILTMVHPEDAPVARDAVTSVVEGAAGYEIEFRVSPRELGQELWVASRARARYDGAGELRGLQGVVGDISARKAQEAALRESEARFRAMADSAPAPVWVTSAAGPIEFVNKAFLEFSGKPATALLGDGWIRLLHPDDIAGVAERRAKARERSEPYEFEARFKAADGEWCWMHASSRPRFDEAGAFQGYVGLAVDVTETRAAQVSQQLLINELNHRVKNTLSTVQSIARQTMKEGLITRSAREAFTDRLLALSSAHNVLTRQAWESADLADIIAEAVRPYDEPSRPRVLVDGPQARLGPRVALALSMAIHELATNATKYGSLSAPSGTVSLSWRRCADARTLEIIWAESGGPPVGAPERRGFGSRLLVQGLVADLGKPAVLTFGEQGLSCLLLVPTLPT